MALKVLKNCSCLATLQESGDSSQLLKKLDKSLIGLNKNFVPSVRKHPDRRVHPLESTQISGSRPAALETWVAYKITRIEFLETNDKINWSS